MNYYRRYVGDYLRDTMRLTPTDHGVYGLMLDFCYAEERSLPLDLDEIHAICKAIRPEDRRSVEKVLGAYFVREVDGYHNARVDKEIATSQQARLNGKKHTSGTGNTTGATTGILTKPITGERTGTTTEMVSKKGGGSGHPPAASRQPPAASLQPPTAAASRESPAPGVDKSAAAAKEKGYIYPGKLTHAEQESAAKALNGSPLAQSMLDELAGVMESTHVEKPIGLLKSFVKRERVGEMSYSHAPRIQTARELIQVTAELAAAGKGDVLA